MNKKILAQFGLDFFLLVGVSFFLQPFLLKLLGSGQTRLDIMSFAFAMATFNALRNNYKLSLAQSILLLVAVAVCVTVCGRVLFS